MRIKKIRQTQGAIASVADVYTTDNNATYNAPYVNNLHTYSTDEIRIGTYLGKPLYRKVINIGNLPNNTYKNVAHNINNLDTIVDLYGYAGDSNGTRLSLNDTTIRTYASNTNITLETTADRSSFTAYTTIEYTKTTD